MVGAAAQTAPACVLPGHMLRAYHTLLPVFRRASAPARLLPQPALTAGPPLTWLMMNSRWVRELETEVKREPG